MSRTAWGLIATGALLAVAACTPGAMASEDETPADTRAGINYLSDITDGGITHFDCSTLGEYNGIHLGDNSKMIDFFRAMPTGADMETFAILADSGVFVVDYPVGAIAPPAELLDPVLTAIADCGREMVGNLETVRFMVPQGGVRVPHDF